jgi:hypothetical protein
LRFQGGDIAVIVGPNCASACEFFSHNLTQENRAQIVGAYPTSGLGGSIGVFLMPDFELIQFTVGRAVDMDGEIHIEGKGVAPTVRVPTTAETLFYEGDILLDTAVATLIGAPLPFGAEAGVETAPADAPATEAPAAAETPAAAEETPVAVEETPAAPEETPAAVEETPVAVEETPAAPEETPAAVEETPVAEATPAAEDTQTTPAPDASQPAEAATPAAVSTAAFAVGDQVRVAVAGPRAFVFATPAGGLSGAVRNGATYTVLELSADGLWARIDSSPTGAWIKVEFLQKTE